MIDLFAGPGGLGEGFSSLKRPDGSRAFDIRLSVEKDSWAHRTLETRSFYRKFAEVPDEYYAYVRGEIDRDKLFDAYPEEAALAGEEAWCFELGSGSHEGVRRRIEAALGDDPGDWVLVGGPPCQAYSVVGRSRMRNHKSMKDGYEFEKDSRHFLYREYLRTIVDHRPAVFVMENVPGLLSATSRGQKTFELVLSDLTDPIGALRGEGYVTEADLSYRVVPVTQTGLGFDDAHSPTDFVVRCEEFGVPQRRHRVILVGVRSDLGGRPATIAASDTPVGVHSVISDLPPLRSRISRGDTEKKWRSAISNIAGLPCLETIGEKVRVLMREAVSEALLPDRTLDTGGRFVAWKNDPRAPEPLKSWYTDERLNGVLNHEARAHMESDLWRYMFCAAFAAAYGRSPKLRDFPVGLLPNHQNVSEEKAERRRAAFADRFRVQVGSGPSTTVVSHISKDGHYYIHPDSAQCRSMTVREAARLQTFPDNYFFEGPRTAQYHQVGNAVPPLVAREIASSIASFMAGNGSHRIIAGPNGSTQHSVGNLSLPVIDRIKVISAADVA